MSLCNNNHDTGTEVYIAVLQKAIHARFAVVYRQWKETNVDKRSNVALRTFIRLSKKAKAGDSTTAGKKKKNTGGSTSGKKKKAATCSINSEEAKLNIGRNVKILHGGTEETEEIKEYLVSQ